jgi:cytochrome c-type biogenesis protein CcmH/NrfG
VAPDRGEPESVEPEPSRSVGGALFPGRADEASGSRARDAETWFRKGEGLLRGKRYMEAAEAFGMAAHLDPEAGEYRAHLGYVLHLANPRNEMVRREALEHIARGVKLSPDREKPLLFLGRVFKAAGEVENARKVFRRALRIRPECHDAQRELRQLDARPPKRRSLLDRLLGR